MRNYTILKKFIIAFLVMYFIGGLFTEVLPAWRDKSMIPFYSWFLFDTVPNARQVPALRILEYRGNVLEPPPLFAEAQGLVDDPQSPKARELIGELSKSIMASQEEEGKRLRAFLEQSFLPPCVRYEVVLIEYDPIERWKTGHYTVQSNRRKQFITPCPSQ